MEPRIQYAKTSDGVNIAYTVLGSGPAIVSPSNIWGNIHMYRSGIATNSVIDELTAMGWSIVTYDGRGAGSSDRDVSDLSLETRLCDLEAVIDRAAPDRFAMYSFLQGSPTSIAYGAQNPERLSALILMNPFASGREYYRVVPSMRLSQDTLDMAEDEWEFHLLSMANAVTGYSDAEAARNLAQAFRTGISPRVYHAYRRAAIEIDVTALLPLLSVPTLVILDQAMTRLANAGLARGVVSRIPDARFIETANSGQAIDEFLRENGLQPLKAPSTEQATFRTVLFTDLVGHTEMMSRLGDERGRAVLREHERITREVLKANGGTEVKTMGDGFMASFASVTKAVQCAILLQRALAERDLSVRPEALEGLSVRVGLNAGEPIEEDGDLFGATVILASRIAAKADGGEILVADTVRGLCSGKGFLFADRGEFVAKGFEEPVRVYEVRWRE